ncbi:MAG: hypothetical protein K9J12_17155 [Melioribacteraceae bacterium]|nr:hypothetical protein [Melioribacteraceae bacterium]MCF8413972.1 hypothetical protein [Melioribacteraceae bacterium]
MIALVTFIIVLFTGAVFFRMLSKRGIIIQEIIETLFGGNRKSTNSNAFARLKSKLLSISIILFLLMFLSSFLPTSISGEFLQGLFLIIHVMIAPIFAISLSLLILLFASEFKLGEPDYIQLREVKTNFVESRKAIIKIVFWLLSITSIPLLISILLILYPIFGTDLQEFYVLIHRISASIFTILAIILLYLIMLEKSLTNTKTN